MGDPEVEELKKRILSLTEDLAGLRKELAAAKSNSETVTIKEEIKQLAASLEPMRARLKELTPEKPPEPKPAPIVPDEKGGGYELGHFEE